MTAHYTTGIQYETQQWHGKTYLTLPFAQKGPHAVIECPFCTAHLGKPIHHLHGVVDRDNPREGNGHRIAHCDDFNVELTLPDGQIINAGDGYFIYYERTLRG